MTLSDKKYALKHAANAKAELEKANKVLGPLTRDISELACSMIDALVSILMEPPPKENLRDD